MAHILESSDISRALKRIAHEIVEHNQGVENIVLMGIPTRGRYLADRLQENLESISGAAVPTGILDITLYRDDYRIRPPKALEKTLLPDGGIEGRDVVLVDDVLYSGRTIRAALDALGEFSRPKSVQLAVLVDRGHRELPIRADYVGKNIPTSLKESVRVHLMEVDGEDSVEILGERQ